MTMCNPKLLSAAMLAIASLFSAGAWADENQRIFPEFEWGTKLNSVYFDHDKFIGQRFSAKCMRGTKSDTPIHGTDSYSSDTPVCAAAVHAGKIGDDGGIVTVQLNPGMERYVGTEQNGVTSADRPATKRSFVFVDDTSPDAANEILLSRAPNLKWESKFTATGFAHKQLTGQRFTFRCPSVQGDLRYRTIVGTDLYAFSSMICRAAVHAGKLTTDGGFVTVELAAGGKKLIGSIRNGIESKSGSSGPGTLFFVENPA